MELYGIENFDQWSYMWPKNTLKVSKNRLYFIELCACILIICLVYGEIIKDTIKGINQNKNITLMMRIQPGVLLYIKIIKSHATSLGRDTLHSIRDYQRGNLR